jgi:putative transposase
MSTYAITTVTYSRRALFLKTANAESLVNILFHYRDQGRYLLHGFAVMPEHLHVLLTPATGQTIERCAQCIKGGFSHQMRTNFRGEIWQAGFHDHRVRDASDFHNQLKYIALNPMRRRLQSYAHVHTEFSDRLDPAPIGL